MARPDAWNRRRLDRIAARLGYLPRRTDIVTHFDEHGQHKLWLVAPIDKKRLRHTEEAFRQTFQALDDETTTDNPANEGNS